MNGTTAYLTADVDRLTERIANGPAHLRPIMRAVRDGGATFAIITQGQHRFDIPTHRPTIVIFGDDLREALGPAGFHRKSLRRLFAPCRAVVVVSAAPLEAAYASAAATSVSLGALSVLIETRPEQEAAWLSFVKDHAPDAAVLLATLEPAGGLH